MSHADRDMFCHSSELTIDLSAIRFNYRTIATRVAPAECGAVVKADAYGLGVAAVSRALTEAGCRTFFVAHLREAFALEQTLSPSCTIFVLNGLDPGGEDPCADRGILPVLNSMSQVERWRGAARRRGRPLGAALQIDSGMSRLGLSPGMAATLADDPGFHDEVELRLLMTHLACADDHRHRANTAQLDQFRLAQAYFPGVPASIANSGGSFLDSSFHLDLVRPGIALFGVSVGAGSETLQPVVQLTARVLQIREVPEGTGVGYGLDYIAPGPRRLATVAIGYADGWLRQLGGTGAAWHGGKRLPIVGRISMDSMTIDVSALPAGAIEEGEFVELIGPSQPLEVVAHAAGTIPYEILTRLGPRHRRIFSEGKKTSILGTERLP
jgi:alanine racemase